MGDKFDQSGLDLGGNYQLSKDHSGLNFQVIRACYVGPEITGLWAFVCRSLLHYQGTGIEDLSDHAIQIGQSNLHSWTKFGL